MSNKTIEQRAFVHMSDGEVVGVYLIDEDKVSLKFPMQIDTLEAMYSQRIHNIIPEYCDTTDDVVDMIKDKNPEDDEDEVPCEHEMRMGEVAASDAGSGNQIVDVLCKICGASGSTIITDEDINW